MVPDDFIDNEAQEFFAEVGIKIGIAGQGAQPFDLGLFALWIGGRQAMLGLVSADRLRDLEALGEDKDQRRVDIVDALAIPVQRVVRHNVTLFSGRYAVFLGAAALARNPMLLPL